MYKEEYENRGFPFRDFLLKLILIIIFVFLLIWLLPKFISPAIDTKSKANGNNGNNTSEKVDLSPLTSQIFADNIERAHKSGVKYIAQPGGSVRDDLVIECCNKYDMVMAFTGIRLFHH